MGSEELRIPIPDVQSFSGVNITSPRKFNFERTGYVMFVNKSTTDSFFYYPRINENRPLEIPPGAFLPFNKVQRRALFYLTGPTDGTLQAWFADKPWMPILDNFGVGAPVITGNTFGLTGDPLNTAGTPVSIDFTTRSGIDRKLRYLSLVPNVDVDVAVDIGGGSPETFRIFASEPWDSSRIGDSIEINEITYVNVVAGEDFEFRAWGY